MRSIRLAALGLSLVLGPSVHAAQMERVSDFGANPGALGMFKYVPDALPAKAPLVVALHGCTQSHTDYDDEPGWLQMADRHGIALLFPRQNGGNQPFSCFNWASEDHQRRGKGEPQSLISMVDRMIADHGLDPARVYFAGLSGGASMTAVMLATYPDRIAGGAIVGGIPYRCASDDFSALSCMGGEEKSAKTWGDYVRKAAPEGVTSWPTVSIWHGRKDDIVNYAMAEELVKQWTDVHGIAATPTRTDTVDGYSRSVFEKDGRPVVELWSFDKMGHGSPIAPGDAATQCGRKSQYAHDVGLCGSYRVLQFWGLVTP